MSYFDLLKNSCEKLGKSELLNLMGEKVKKIYVIFKFASTPNVVLQNVVTRYSRFCLTEFSTP